MLEALKKKQALHDKHALWEVDTSHFDFFTPWVQSVPVEKAGPMSTNVLRRLVGLCFLPSGDRISKPKWRMLKKCLLLGVNRVTEALEDCMQHEQKNSIMECLMISETSEMSRMAVMHLPLMANMAGVPICLLGTNSSTLGTIVGTNHSFTVGIKRDRTCISEDAVITQGVDNLVQAVVTYAKSYTKAYPLWIPQPLPKIRAHSLQEVDPPTKHAKITTVPMSSSTPSTACAPPPSRSSPAKAPAKEGKRGKHRRKKRKHHHKKKPKMLTSPTDDNATAPNTIRTPALTSTESPTIAPHTSPVPSSIPVPIPQEPHTLPSPQTPLPPVTTTTPIASLPLTATQREILGLGKGVAFRRRSRPETASLQQLQDQNTSIANPSKN
ncbi:hypothetical protein Pelo_7337 [Pelomyxa schiedti]|nr:hypothetical protein Pelo_7337 [Pelomyxa schiedti]